ncbi:MAG: ABC-2 type transport system ATP-binding protein [bacterium]|nr:MAG: ABC-2 type transport system ATP-binding protein [bacterium]
MWSIIIVNNLTIKYGDFAAVKELSFYVRKGDIFGFLGPNGSGKTTLIKALCGLITPHSGKATIFELDVRKDSDKIKERIGYMSQKFSLYDDLTAMENLNFYARIYGLEGNYLKQRKEQVIALLELKNYLGIYTKRLSGGWKQRLALGCAILHEPEVVFLDEPTAGIDPVARRSIWNLLAKLSGQGITFFVTTHYMDEAERCTRVAYIYLSKLIAFGTPSELKILPDICPPGTVRLQVIAESPMAAYELISNLPYIMEYTIFGQAIHVLMDIAFPQEKLLTDLVDARMGQIIVNPLAPSLEDVFVTLTNKLANT